jgi:hypothetical protein
MAGLPEIQASWNNAMTVSAGNQWRCAYCNQFTRSAVGFYAGSNNYARIQICGNCNYPTLFTFMGGPTQMPAPAPAGEPIRNLAPDVEQLFSQARAALSAGAPVAATLTCRKILHHVAVEKRRLNEPTFTKFGNFVQAIEWLDDNRYLPPGARDTWVDFIRDRANEENHQIVIITAPEAAKLVELTAHLLRHIYDLPKP